MGKYKPIELKRKKIKTKVMDTKETKFTPIAPHLDSIMKAVEKGGGDVGDDTVLGILKQGKANYEEIRKENMRRDKGK